MEIALPIERIYEAAGPRLKLFTSARGALSRGPISQLQADWIAEIPQVILQLKRYAGDRSRESLSLLDLGGGRAADNPQRCTVD
jgi:hypothetical protein